MMRVRNYNEEELLTFFNGKTNYLPSKEFVGLKTLRTREDLSDRGLMKVQLSDGRICYVYSIDFE